jgi:hypothetical protein
MPQADVQKTSFWLTVVNAGQFNFASETSSYPTTDTSSGTRRPCPRRWLMAAIAIRSQFAKMVSTPGTRSSIGDMERWVKVVREKGAELVLFPELNLNGDTPSQCTIQCLTIHPRHTRLPEVTYPSMP